MISLFTYMTSRSRSCPSTYCTVVAMQADLQAGRWRAKERIPQPGPAAVSRSHSACLEYRTLGTVRRSYVRFLRESAPQAFSFSSPSWYNKLRRSLADELEKWGWYGSVVKLTWPDPNFYRYGIMQVTSGFWERIVHCLK